MALKKVKDDVPKVPLLLGSSTAIFQHQEDEIKKHKTKKGGCEECGLEPGYGHLLKDGSWFIDI